MIKIFYSTDFRFFLKKKSGNGAHGAQAFTFAMEEIVKATELLRQDAARVVAELANRNASAGSAEAG